MHGEALDWIVLNTVKNGSSCYSGRFHGAESISLYKPYEFTDLDYQPVFKRVFEVGSLDVNGSMRDYNFLGRDNKWVEKCGVEEYIGLDLIAGPSVDIVGNSHAVPLDDSQFDLVLCLNMLEHDDAPDLTFKECYRVLKENGTFILSVPDETSPEHGTEEAFPQLGGGSTHYNFFTKETIYAMLEEAGFVIIAFQVENGYIYSNATKRIKSEN